MLKIDKKERERILKLHSIVEQSTLGGQTSVPTVSTGFDYSTAQFRGATPGNERWYKLYKEFCDAVYGLGTNEDKLLAVIRKIANWQEFQYLNTLLQQSHNYNSNNYKDFAQVIQQELGRDDCGIFDTIKEHLNKLGIPNYSEAYDTTTEKCRPDLFRIGRKPDSDNEWPSDLSCVSSHPNAQQTTLNNGSIAYIINNEVYYNNKRKKDQNGTMVNYSCNDEIFRQSSGQQNTGGTTTNTGGSSSGNLTKQIQKTLGIPETGKMDQETINKAYDAVSKR